MSLSSDNSEQQQQHPSSSSTDHLPCFGVHRTKPRSSRRLPRNVKEEHELVKALLKLARRGARPNIVINNNDPKISSGPVPSPADDDKTTLEQVQQEYKKVDVQVQGHVPSSSSVAGDEKLKEHKCAVCGIVFDSGQALGGHKRKHYDGGDGNPAAKRSHKTELNNFPAVVESFTTNYFCDEEFNLQ